MNKALVILLFSAILVILIPDMMFIVIGFGFIALASIFVLVGLNNKYENEETHD